MGDDNTDKYIPHSHGWPFVLLQICALEFNHYIVARNNRVGKCYMQETGHHPNSSSEWAWYLGMVSGNIISISRIVQWIKIFGLSHGLDFDSMILLNFKHKSWWSGAVLLNLNSGVGCANNIKNKRGLHTFFIMKKNCAFEKNFTMYYILFLFNFFVKDRLFYKDFVFVSFYYNFTCLKYIHGKWHGIKTQISVNSLLAPKSLCVYMCVLANKL